MQYWNIKQKIVLFLFTLPKMAKTWQNKWNSIILWILCVYFVGYFIKFTWNYVNYKILKYCVNEKHFGM